MEGLWANTYVFLIYVCFKIQLISISIGIFIFIHTHTHIYDLIVLVLQYIYILKAQIMFILSLILFQMLIDIFTSLYIDFNWNSFGIKMYFMFHLQLVSKSTIGILNFFFKWYQLFIFVNYNLISLVS